MMLLSRPWFSETVYNTQVSASSWPVERFAVSTLLSMKHFFMIVLFTWNVPSMSISRSLQLGSRPPERLECTRHCPSRMSSSICTKSQAIFCWTSGSIALKVRERNGIYRVQNATHISDKIYESLRVMGIYAAASFSLFKLCTGSQEMSWMHLHLLFQDTLRKQLNESRNFSEYSDKLRAVWESISVTRYFLPITKFFNSVKAKKDRRNVKIDSCSILKRQIGWLFNNAQYRILHNKGGFAQTPLRLALCCSLYKLPPRDVECRRLYQF